MFWTSISLSLDPFDVPAEECTPELRIEIDTYVDQCSLTKSDILFKQCEMKSILFGWEE